MRTCVAEGCTDKPAEVVRLDREPFDMCAAHYNEFLEALELQKCDS